MAQKVAQSIKVAQVAHFEPPLAIFWDIYEMGYQRKISKKLYKTMYPIIVPHVPHVPYFGVHYFLGYFHSGTLNQDYCTGMPIPIVRHLPFIP